MQSHASKLVGGARSRIGLHVRVRITFVTQRGGGGGGRCHKTRSSASVAGNREARAFDPLTSNIHTLSLIASDCSGGVS